MVELSVIVPLYNEADNVEILYERIVDALVSMGINFEILFVDDGSNDETFPIVKRLAEKDKRLRVVKFRRNYGQTPAMVAGIDYAKGRILITMDGDLQNDPTDIPKFIETLREGFDMVVGWRYQRKDKWISRKIPSKIANWIIGRVTGVPIKDNGCSLKAFRATLIKNLPLYSEMHRFIPAIASLSGARIGEIKVKHHARKYGVSKYGLSRTYKVAIDILTIKTIVSFSSKPMLWFGIIAIPSVVVGSVAFGKAFISVMEGGGLPLVEGGVGVLCAALSFFLLMGGVLSELVLKTGSIDLQRISMLTTKNISVNAVGERANGIQETEAV